MAEPIEESYFNWLCAKVLAPRDKRYRDLLVMLHRTEYVWVLIEDRNRAEDGLELRTYFLNESRLPNDRNWFTVGCSVFEMLLAFADRAAFQTEISREDWFWVFIKNLGLEKYEQVLPSDTQDIDDILYEFVWRTYDIDGGGGIFPLRWASRNQKEVEIWYQFCDYLVDVNLV